MQSMTREEFASRYLDDADRSRIANLMCRPDAYLARCLGPVTRPADPASRGRKLSPERCRTFFRVQLGAVAARASADSEVQGSPALELSPQQARFNRQKITEGLQALLVDVLERQGARVDDSPTCATRLERTMADVASSPTNTRPRATTPPAADTTSSAAGTDLR